MIVPPIHEHELTLYTQMTWTLPMVVAAITAFLAPSEKPEGGDAVVA